MLSPLLYHHLHKHFGFLIYLSTYMIHLLFNGSDEPLVFQHSQKATFSFIVRSQQRLAECYCGFQDRNYVHFFKHIFGGISYRKLH